MRPEGSPAGAAATERVSVKRKNAQVADNATHDSD